MNQDGSISAASRAARIREQVLASARTIASLEQEAAGIDAICACVVACLKRGGTVFSAGNGGAAAEALHMAEELTGRFRTNRRSLPGLALVADCTALTCIGNDFGFDYIFSRQLEGLGRRGDVLVVFTTSGNSPNLVQAVQAAERLGLATICLLGRDGGRLAGKGTHELIVPGTANERIQEAHQVVMHIILDAVESAFPCETPEPVAPRREESR